MITVTVSRVGGSLPVAVDHQTGDYYEIDEQGVLTLYNDEGDMIASYRDWESVVKING